MTWSRRRSSALPALFAVGALACACSSDPSPPLEVSFQPADCRGQLVEVARLAKTSPLVNSVRPSNNLSIDGDTLYVAYQAARIDSPLPHAGGIVAIPLSGGDPTVVAAADPAKTLFWDTDDFWVAGGQMYLQNGATVASVPADAANPGTLPLPPAERTPGSAYAHDAAFGYAATTQQNTQLGLQTGVWVTRTPLDGSAPTTLVEEPTGTVELGGMADAGDALLLQLIWDQDPTSDGQIFSGIWRIPKDGSARSVVRPDVDWQSPSIDVQWLAWDGTNVFGEMWLPINRNGIDGQFLEARVAPDGTSAPVATKLSGRVVTTRGDEVLSLQSLYSPASSPGLLVASSKGAPAGTVVACGGNTPLGVVPAGIAADDGGIYVAYQDTADTVVARVAP